MKDINAARLADVFLSCYQVSHSQGRPFLLDQIKTNYNMKTLNISSEQLSDAINRLWGACRLNGATFTIDPVLGRIFVYDMSHETIAAINVIDITDDYDLSDVIFNNR